MIGAERTLAQAAIDELNLVVAQAGVLIGHDHERRPVLLPVFRPQPTNVVLVAGLWAARILLFRCLALGPRVVVHTSDPRRWFGMDDAATGGSGRMHISNADRLPAVPASAEEPVLYVADGVSAPRGTLSAWQSRLQIAPTLTPEAAIALREAHAAVLQRMWPEECAQAVELSGAEGAPEPLAAMRDDVVALLSTGPYRMTWLAPTQIEQAMFGPAGRG